MSKLTRSEFIEKSEISWAGIGLNELERLGVILPDPPEPKRLTALEACAVIARGGRVKSKNGFSYPVKHNGRIEIRSNLEPYTEIKKTIEIDAEVWVNVYPDSDIKGFYSTKDMADAYAHETRISCERFELKRIVEVDCE